MTRHELGPASTNPPELWTCKGSGPSTVRAGQPGLQETARLLALPCRGKVESPSHLPPRAKGEASGLRPSVQGQQCASAVTRRGGRPGAGPGSRRGPGLQGTGGGRGEQPGPHRSCVGARTHRPGSGPSEKTKSRAWERARAAFVITGGGSARAKVIAGAKQATKGARAVASRRPSGWPICSHCLRLSRTCPSAQNTGLWGGWGEYTEVGAAMPSQA